MRAIDKIFQQYGDNRPPVGGYVPHLAGRGSKGEGVGASTNLEYSFPGFSIIFRQSFSTASGSVKDSKPDDCLGIIPVIHGLKGVTTMKLIEDATKVLGEIVSAIAINETERVVISETRFNPIDNLSETYPDLRTPGLEGQAREEILLGVIKAVRAAEQRKMEQADGLLLNMSESSYKITVHRNQRKDGGVEYQLKPVEFAEGYHHRPLPVALYINEPID